MSTELTVAVCLFNSVDAQDYQGPVELFGFVNAKNPGGIDPPPRYSLKIKYISSNLEYVQPAFGPRIVPDASYKDIITGDQWQQFDIVLVPGGPGARPDQCPKDLLEFIKLQTPNAKYVLSVCTGSWILAMSGILDGKKATTNKKAFLCHLVGDAFTTGIRNIVELSKHDQYDDEFAGIWGDVE